MSIPAQRSTGRTGVSESEAWFRRAPSELRLPLDGSLSNFALATMPKAPERIRTAYAQRGSPKLLPSVIREIASELNLHVRQVENVLYALPRTEKAEEPMTETRPETMTEARFTAPPAPGRQLLTAMLPTERPAACKNLNWDKAHAVAAALDRLSVDLRYFVAEPVTAQMAVDLEMTVGSVSQYTSAVRRACGIECLGRRPEGVAAAEPAPRALPDGFRIPHVPHLLTCPYCSGEGTAEGCPQCAKLTRAELETRNHNLTKQWNQLASVITRAYHETFGKEPCGLAIAVVELRQGITDSPAIPADWTPTTDAIHALPEPLRGYWEQMERSVQATDERLAALQARDTPQPVAAPEVRLTEALPALTDAMRDEAAQLVHLGAEFSADWQRMTWAQKAATLQLAAEMAALAAGR